MAKKQDSKSADPAGGKGGHRRFLRYCFVLLMAGACVLAWVSLVTFCPTDPPSRAVCGTSQAVANAAGMVGAHVAYLLRYWLGGGAYMGLFFITVAAGALLMGGKLTELPWRVIGVFLLVAATSAAIYMTDSAAGEDVARGTSGIIGTAAGRFLLSRFAVAGAWLIVALSFCVGMMLAADNFVLRIPQLGRKVWHKRNELPSVVGALRLRAPQAAMVGASGMPLSPRAAAAAPAAAGRVAARERPPSPPKPPPMKPSAVAVVAPPAPPKLTPALPRPQAPEPAKPIAALPRPVESPSAAPKKDPAPVLKGPAPKTDGPATDKYVLPPSDLLAEPSTGYLESQEAQAERKREVLQQTLNDFNVTAEVIGYMTGPVITLYELSLSPGVKVAQIGNLANDIARALAVPGVRIVSPIPGKDTVGIEVPNMQKETVRLRELMNTAPEADQKMTLPLYLGKDASGAPLVADLATMPHMLIAGTTGSGKSVCINAIIMAMLMKRTPEQVRLILVDPKMVEMAAFENVPHLLCPIVNDMRKAEEILEWAVGKMDERYELLKEANVKNVAQYNRLGPQEIYDRFHVTSEEERKAVPTQLPCYVIIIDELADLIMTSDKDVENHIIRIAQKARAVGIHLILATQRPSVNVVTGLIKSNMPCRVSFRVASRQESRIVLDQNGADVLLGQGDMLFLQPGTSNLMRAQGTFVDDAEVRTVVNELRQHAAQPQYDNELMRLQSGPEGGNSGERDEMFDKAVELVLASQRGSVSLLQRRMSIGYSRASRIIDQMADAGILGDYKGSQARECRMTLEDWQALQASIQADQSGASSANGEPTSA